MGSFRGRQTSTVLSVWAQHLEEHAFVVSDFGHNEVCRLPGHAYLHICWPAEEKRDLPAAVWLLTVPCPTSSLLLWTGERHVRLLRGVRSQGGGGLQRSGLWRRSEVRVSTEEAQQAHEGVRVRLEWPCVRQRRQDVPQHLSPPGREPQGWAGESTTGHFGPEGSVWRFRWEEIRSRYLKQACNLFKLHIVVGSLNQ